MNRKINNILTLSIIVLIIFLDQSSKFFFINYLKTVPGWKITVIPLMDIVYSWNYGISFGMFSNYYQYSNNVFLLINSCIVIYLIFLLLKSESKLETIGYNMIIGGALGNIIDRITYGGVFDFIRLHYHDYDFPIFNMADSFITIGTIIIIFDNFLLQNRMVKTI
ncbi:MAG: signal peptidase II [Rickettsiaceae bacterium]|nr:signal peptidase II [Rickettsiaceae bacterium]